MAQSGGGWAAVAASLLPAVRQAVAGCAGREALLLPPLGAARRRAARLLLHDAARTGDGTVIEAASGELLLLGCEAAVVDRAALSLEGLGLGTGERWRLDPEAAAPLFGWAARSMPTPRPSRHPPALLLGLPDDFALDRVVIRRTILRIGAQAAPARMGERIAISRRRLATVLGSDAQDPDLLDAAATEAERRLAASAVRFALPQARRVPFMLRPGSNDDPPPLPGAIALLGIGSLAEPRFADRAEALLRAGWAEVGVDGLDASLVPLLDLSALPRQGPLLLRWSPALADRAATSALRRFGALSRLVLTGCDNAEAITWGVSTGIDAFTGPVIEDLLAAARRDAA